MNLHNKIQKHLLAFPYHLGVDVKHLICKASEFELWINNKLIGISDLYFETDKNLYLFEIKSGTSKLSYRNGIIQIRNHFNWSKYHHININSGLIYPKIQNPRCVDDLIIEYFLQTPKNKSL